uniref:ATP synthase subunit 8 n=1 Tax=Tropidomya abbreviata TaxID=102404 RepID=A0A1U9XPK9_9BIVA|nr:ATP synthase F0 subunit 8 [Tropidomya abbreviata]AQZ26182.1 ATP synthase subunit 8 [Tropidomya abbreviata]
MPQLGPFQWLVIYGMMWLMLIVLFCSVWWVSGNFFSVSVSEDNKDFFLLGNFLLNSSILSSDVMKMVKNSSKKMI